MIPFPIVAQSISDLPRDTREAINSQGSGLRNLIPISSKTVDKLSLTLDKKAKDIAKFLLTEMAGTSLGYEQALQYSLLTLRDIYGVNSKIRPEMNPLLEWVGICGVICKYTMSIEGLPKEVRGFIVEQFVQNIAQKVVNSLKLPDLAASSSFEPRSLQRDNQTMVLDDKMPDTLYRKTRSR